MISITEKLRIRSLSFYQSSIKVFNHVYSKVFQIVSFETDDQNWTIKNDRINTNVKNKKNFKSLKKFIYI